jgi:transcriptional regulator GlxA family with amidase domain
MILSNTPFLKGPQPSSRNYLSEPSVLSSKDAYFLLKIKQLVLMNLDDADFGCARLAQKMLLSQSQLFRKLKTLTGRSAAVHISGIRLQKGRELLRKSELTVSEVAYDCGFTDPAYFSRTFSKEFGTAPSSVRRA